ncbi:arylesterase [Oceaniradius stylonematis]|jgi:acyl-CoA thioesterase-1|uniref:Arylesterase n=1 Tax=Oceaniradius stylonematis TaxID=2184161 RepID=A0A3A8AC35_9HYPH|nr:arylesterase [Oceaniradius stylonematis]RKF07425.1 arylesterase [Oceaniradius stylonematis]RNC96782.1 MAG: arylesterase [Oricola sp.]
MFKQFLRFFAAAGFAFGLATLPAKAETVRGVGFGDSLMAGYQLPAGTGFPEQLEAALRAEGFDVAITNAGVSGDTSSGGLARLDWSVPDGTDFVILELGGNDALRGISPDVTRANLDAMIERLKERDIDVILAGMRAPPNMGGDYADRFDAIFANLAETHDVPLYPFFLDGAITVDGMMQADGIHPTADGVAQMVERFLPLMRTYLSGKEAG